MNLLKKSIFFLKDSYNIMNFMKFFMQKYEFYIWVYFKRETKSEDRKFYRD